MSHRLAGRSTPLHQQQKKHDPRLLTDGRLERQTVQWRRIWACVAVACRRHMWMHQTDHQRLERGCWYQTKNLTHRPSCRREATHRDIVCVARTSRREVAVDVQIPKSRVDNTPDRLTGVTTTTRYTNPRLPLPLPSPLPVSSAEVGNRCRRQDFSFVWIRQNPVISNPTSICFHVDR